MERLEGIASLLSHKQAIKLMDTDVSAAHSVHWRHNALLTGQWSLTCFPSKVLGSLQLTLSSWSRYYYAQRANRHQPSNLCPCWPSICPPFPGWVPQQPQRLVVVALEAGRPQLLVGGPPRFGLNSTTHLRQATKSSFWVATQVWRSHLMQMGKLLSLSLTLLWWKLALSAPSPIGDTQQ